MGIAVYDILKSNGASWVEYPGDYTKRIAEMRKIQVFLSLSPTGDALATYLMFHQDEFFELHSLPVGMYLPRSINNEQIANSIYKKATWVKQEYIFTMKNKYGESIALVISPFADAVIVYGFVGNQETILCLPTMS